MDQIISQISCFSPTKFLAAACCTPPQITWRQLCFPFFNVLANRRFDLAACFGCFKWNRLGRKAQLVAATSFIRTKVIPSLGIQGFLHSSTMSSISTLILKWPFVLLLQVTITNEKSKNTRRNLKLWGLPYFTVII